MELWEATAIAVRQIEDAMFKAPATPLPEVDCQLDSRGAGMVHHGEHEEPA